MRTFEVAVLPGDGIGKEVVPEALKVLDAAAAFHGGLSFSYSMYDWNCEYYQKYGTMMPADGLDRLADHEAVFLGAIGNPTQVPDHISLWGLLIPIRRSFEQVLNIRPVKRIQGLPSPLSAPDPFDFVVVRENSEGEYSEVGGRMYQGKEEIAIQNAIFSRIGTERAMRYAFELADKRRRKVTAATKSNGITHTMPFWDEVFQDVSRDYSSIATDSIHIDALTAFLVTKPQRFDVIVASNLFGDILTDLGGAIMGGIGVAPAANLNLNGKYPSMFEPVHGSAPDIAGRGIANPIGQMWTAKMMLDHFGYDELGNRVLDAVEKTLLAGIKTPDLGGDATTAELTAAVIQHLQKETA